ncbi:hypothetical protein SARC_03615 [Sphaeroforma arctica JP610]|uniref:Cytidyltransferase-like domain-containing protein n=1 Tax=Sphaeroforma arctica JP610 TaxID=667725 RepID=A0A0L0G5F9_9EUKA|nr:hypothetical protein SARC_03615 [Sphaeroforma arctica JP610]KNC84159.1 hypothetical protein SARC_03615 [Sphaeroforma arctica JP610]|eukprot:XP_014158061.1 hypothetical protein SARC_03615 [Sphaeroforma arctica JP610]
MLVYVRGVFDLYHSGHATFLQRAYNSGIEIANEVVDGTTNVRLFVHLISDRMCETIRRSLCIPEAERRFVVENNEHVWMARVASDYEADLSGDLEIIRPDVVYVINDNTDNMRNIQSVCKRLNITVVLGKRTQLPGIACRRVRSIKKLIHDQKQRPVSGSNGASSQTATTPIRAVNGSSAHPGCFQEQYGNRIDRTDAAADAIRTHQPDTRPNQPALQRPIVYVSGCFDLLHSGHVAFFNEAASRGQSLYVGLGNDANLAQLKSGSVFPEEERLLLVESIKSVTMATVSRGFGDLDFAQDLDVIKPDVFFVNEDGDRPHKRALCTKKGIEYIVSSRKPQAQLPPRSSTDLKRELSNYATEPSIPHPHADMAQNEVSSENTLREDASHTHSTAPPAAGDCVRLHDFPWRICLTGGWLDQPWVSQVVKDTYAQSVRTKIGTELPGCGVIVVNIKANAAFKTRSSLATSSRRTALELWGGYDNLPKEQTREHLARLLFGAENPPGCEYVSGSQDHLGLLLPGLSWLGYRGGYWPEHIHSLCDADTCVWLQSVLWLVPLVSRDREYKPLAVQNLTVEAVTALADASVAAWKAIEDRDTARLGQALKDTMYAQRCILPNTIPTPEVEEWTGPYVDTTHGYICGHGGGFLFVISDTQVLNGFQVEITTSEGL